jgi:circadian clock protein KaiB
LNPIRTDETKAFEDALAARPVGTQYHFRLFVSGSTPRSLQAIQNTLALCERDLPGRYRLDVTDIYQHPEQVKPEQIIVTPTLVKKFPLPLRKVIGDMSNRERMLTGLDIVPGECARAR